MIDFDHNFYGRQEMMDVLSKRIRGLKDGFRQNVALLGPKYIGKTMLLKQVIDRIDDPMIVSVYVDMEHRDLAYMAKHLSKSLLYFWQKKQNLPLQDDLTLLCHTSRLYIPQTISLIESSLSLLTEEKAREAYHVLLTIPEIFAQETGCKVVLMIDEFHCLEDFGLDDVFIDLGKRLMTQKHTLNIFASSNTAYAQEILNEKLSLLFGNFEVLNLGSLTFNEGIGLIDKNLKGVNMNMQLKNFIVDFTGGHPLYINLLCQELLSVAAIFKQQDVYAPVLTQAVENLIFNPWGVVHRHFELQMTALMKGKAGGILLNMLMCLASGHHKVTTLTTVMPIKAPVLIQRLNVLIASGLVVKNGNYHHIQDKLLSYWLRFVVMKKHQSMDLETGKLRKQFKDELNKAINDFTQVARKDVSLRLSDLMHKFDNEAFVLNGRRYRLNRFSAIESLRLRTASGNVYDAMKAKSDEETWLIVLKKDPLSEHELNLLNDQIQNMADKPQRHVVVALSGVDDNARVRALASKMWIWEEGDVNALMHLFDEPTLVR